jgi:hypothetical protein
MKNGWELIIVCGADEKETTDLDSYNAAVETFEIAGNTYTTRPCRGLLLRWENGVPRLLREFDTE